MEERIKYEVDLLNASRKDEGRIETAKNEMSDDKYLI